jgi:sterol desaturase/sphingolipid hydroxylase (fatty acid hydroxylase superfamily)
MNGFKINNKGSGKVFSNPVLDRLTRTHFAIPVVLYYTVGALTLGYGVYSPEIRLVKYFWLFPAGMFLFSFVEYLIHRFVFHFKAETETAREVQYKIHGIHHQYPRDKDRLVMPPLMSMLLASIFLFLFLFSFGENGWLLFGGFMSGYSTYLMIHYAVHAWRPPSNFLKYLWKHHSLHHYAGDDGAFAVSFPLWDRIFGTMPKSVK